MTKVDAQAPDWEARYRELYDVLAELKRAGALKDYIGDSYAEGPAKAKARAALTKATPQ